MPIYEFKCNDCENIFSEMRKIGDDKNVECPDCKSLNSKKMISNFATSKSICNPSGGG